MNEIVALVSIVTVVGVLASLDYIARYFSDDDDLIYEAFDMSCKNIMEMWR